MKKRNQIIFLFLLIFFVMKPVVAEEINGNEEEFFEEVTNSEEKVYFGEKRELMAVNDFREIYNGEEVKNRGILVRVKKVAEFNGGANWISIMAIDSQIVFCLDPTLSAGIGLDYVQSNEWDNLSWDNKIRIWKVVRFGYQQHNSDNYYIASQILIWRELGHWITPSVNVDKEINQIESDIQNWGIEPSFANKTVELEFAVPKTISDTKNALSQYFVGCPNGVSCDKNQNDLTLRIDRLDYDKNGRVTMTTHGTDDPSWIGIAYVLPGSQTVASIQHTDPATTFELNIKMITGDLKIVKRDEYNQPAGKGHIFEISWDEDFNEVVGKYTTDENGVIEVNGYLPEGNYYLREVGTMNGYMLNSEVLKVYIKAGESNVIKFINQLKEVDLHYVKQDEEWNEILLNGAVFGVEDITESIEPRVLPKNLSKIIDKKKRDYFTIQTGNQYIRVYNPSDKTEPYEGEIEISRDKDFSNSYIYETNAEGLLEVSNLGMLDDNVKNDENSDSKIYYRILSEDQNDSQVKGELVLRDKESLEGWVNIPLKWGRTYEICEKKAPEGYKLPDEENRCQVVTMDMSESINFKIETKSNIRRRMTLKLIKQSGESSKLLNGAEFTIEKVLTEYEMKKLEKEKLAEENVSRVGKYVTGALRIEGEPGQIYQISDVNQDTIYTAELNEEGEWVKYLPNGKYHVKKVGDDEEKKGYDIDVEEGKFYAVDLLYGHEYILCEVKSPNGYLLPNDSCIKFIPKADIGIDIYEVSRINKMIMIPITGVS